MKTINGHDIPEGIKGIVYICKYNHVTCDLDVKAVLYFDRASSALDAYANIRNPESQIAIETSSITLSDSLSALHERMQDYEWRKELSNSL